MATYIELDKSSNLPSASADGRIVLGVDLNGNITLTDVSGSATPVGGIIDTTVSEVQALAASSSLSIGNLYRIADADSNYLYGGTEVIVQAVSADTLSMRGVGKFYNPKYDKNTTGYGIWSNFTTIYTYDNIGDFNENENITGDGGQTATVIGAVAEDDLVFLTNTTGDWSTVNTITGSDSGATAFNDGSSVPTYVSGSTVIWGGRVWGNLLGYVGNASGNYELGSENWELKPFNDTDYNVVWDTIEYDLANDFIQMRQDTASNVVKQSYINWWDNEGVRAIKAFQWGNEWTYNYNNGLANNTVIDSLFECINFRGWKMTDNSITQDSYIANNIFESECYFRRNTFINAGMTNNFLGGNGTSFDSNAMNDMGVYGNVFTADSYIGDNNMHDTWFAYNTAAKSGFYNNVSNGAQFYSNYTANDYDGIGSNNLYFSDINSNTLNRSYIEGNQLKANCYITNNTLSQYSGINNNIIESYSNINDNELYNSNIDDNTVANSSYINDNIVISGSYIQVNTVKNDSGLDACVLVDSATLYSNTISDESYVYNLNLYSGSYIEANQVVGNSQMYNLTLNDNNAYVYANTLQNESYIAQSTLGIATSISYNSLNNMSTISNLVMDSSAFVDKNSLTGNSVIQNITMTAGNNYIGNNSINNNSTLGNFGSAMGAGETNDNNALFNNAVMSTSNINTQFYANLP